MTETYWCELALVGDEVLASVALTISDGRFESIASGAAAPAGSAQLRGFTIPGLANAHSHAFHRALRSRTQTGHGSFWTWRELMYRASERLNPDSYFRLARATFAEMAAAGITGVGEFHYLHHRRDGGSYDNANAMGEAMLAAATEAGIRITLLDTLYLHGGLGGDGYSDVNDLQQRFCDGTADAWVERVEALHCSPTQRLGAAVHSVRAVDISAMRVVAAWAEQRGAEVHAHVSEQTLENEQCAEYHGLTPTALLAESGLLSRRFTAVHGTHLSEADQKLLAAAGSSVCFCPTTERDLGDGIGPSSLLASAGVAIGLGSDSHAVIDLLEEARAIELDERLASRQRGIHAASDLLAMATRNGHNLLGWDNAGTIAVGQRADLVTVSLESVRTAGTTADTAVEAVVFAASAADVSNVVIDGSQVVADGTHMTVDVAAELHKSIVELMEP